MTGILRPFDRLSTHGLVQPNGSLRIDWTHPLAFGLKGYWPLGLRGLADLVTGTRMTPFATAMVATSGQYGPCHTGNGSSAAGFTVASKPIVGGSSAFSVVGLAGATGATAQFYGEDNPSGDIILLGNFSSKIFARYKDDSGTTVTLSGNISLNVNNGVHYVFGMSMTLGATNGFRSFVNGVFDVAGTYSPTTFTTANTSSVGNNGTAGQGWDQQIAWVAVWNRALTDSEQQWIAADPYGFLIPQEPEWPLSALVTPGANIKFRRTLSPVGTRSGSRQMHNV